MNKFDDYDDKPTGLFHKKSRFSKAISSVLISVMLMQHGAILADVIKQNAQQGESLAHELNSQDFMPTINNGELTFPSSGQGNSLQFNMNELYPGTSSSNQRPSSYYFPETGMGDVDSLKGSFESSSQAGSIGNQATQALASDSSKENPSLGGIAYQIVQDAANEPARDWTNDPMMNRTKEIYDDMDIIAKEFTECTEVSSFTETEFTASSPDYETCERVIKPTGNCDIRHQIDTRLQTVDIKVAGKGRTWLTVKFDLKNGSWETISPTDGDYAVAEIPTLNYNEFCSDLKATESSLMGAWDWTGHGIPGDIDSTVWNRVLQAPSCENGLVGIVQVQDTTTSNDPKFVLGTRFSIRILGLRNDGWDTEQCIEALNYANSADEFCKGNGYEVIQGPDKSGCIVLSGVKVCEGGNIFNNLEEPPHPLLHKLDERVHVNALECNFNVGPMDCYIDANGVEQCPYNDGSVTNSCLTLEQDNSCGFISSKCVEGAIDNNGNCLVFEDTYDCGFTAQIPTIVSDTKYECAGPIRCMGADCVNPEREQSTDFARVAALLDAAQAIGQDLMCSDGATSEGGDENIDIGCTIFEGEGSECKKAVGGVVNCCEKPKGISLTDYIGLIMGARKMHTAIVGIDSKSSLYVIRSGYEALTQPITSAFESISKPFTGLIDNIKGVVDKVSTTISELKNTITDKIAEMFNTVFQRTAESTGAGAAAGVGTGVSGDQVGNAIVNQLGSVINIVSTVYTIYSVTMLVIQMIYKCTEKELELNVNRVLKNTHHIGSYCRRKVLGVCIEKREAYCVFKSPMSRILQEQIRSQLGMNFGSPEEPSCDGITIEQLSAVDWERVNLDEWLAILSETGNLKDTSINMESLTGSGNALNLGDRTNATERTLERFEDLDIEQIRRDSTNLQGAPVFTP